MLDRPYNHARYDDEEDVVTPATYGSVWEAGRKEGWRDGFWLGAGLMFCASAVVIITLVGKYWSV